MVTVSRLAHEKENAEIVMENIQEYCMACN